MRREAMECYSVSFFMEARENGEKRRYIGDTGSDGSIARFAGRKYKLFLNFYLYIIKGVTPDFGKQIKIKLDKPYF